MGYNTCLWGQCLDDIEMEGHAKDENNIDINASIGTRNNICLGSMGLHQNNFKSSNSMINPIHGTHENTIVEVFRKFRDHCILKFRDGIAHNPTFKPKADVKGIFIFVKMIS